MSTTITTPDSSDPRSTVGGGEARDTYSSRARAAMTKTPKNPNPQPLPAEVKPPRTAPAQGNRVRLSTSSSSGTDEGKEKPVASSNIISPSDGDEEDGWQRPKSPARRSASPSTYSNVIQDDNRSFPGWMYNNSLLDENPEFGNEHSYDRSESDNKIIMPPIIVLGKDTRIEDVSDEDGESIYVPEGEGINRDNKENSLLSAIPEVTEPESGFSDQSADTSNAFGKGIDWSQLPDDGDIGPLPEFENLSQSSRPIIIVPGNNSGEVNDKGQRSPLQKDISAVAVKMEKLSAENAELITKQASIIQANQSLKEELERLKLSTPAKKPVVQQANGKEHGRRSRSARASSALPEDSAVARAIAGDQSRVKGIPGSGDKDKGSSKRPGDTPDKGKKPVKKGNNPRKVKKSPRGGGPSEPSDSSDSSSSDGDSSNSDSDDIFDEEPESIRSGDSERTKKDKRAAKKRYRGRIARFKYQQAFLKTSPPFTYNGEVQSTLFKKWVREVRLWVEYGCIRDSAGVILAGKYLGGRAYQFFERDVLALKKKYSLTEFFEKLFDYVFPVDFRMQQRDKFDACRQDNRSVLDFLRKLQEIADTVGDMEDRDIVLAFWRRSQPYLRSEMARDGLDPTIMTLTELEDRAVCFERAHLLATEEGKRGKQVTRFPTSRRETFTPQSSVLVASSSSKNTPRPTIRNDFGNKKPSGSFKQTSNKERNARIKKLRQDGACFQCESKGHLSKDCPERLNKRPPIRLANAEFISPAEARLAAVDEGSSLGLFSISIDVYEGPETLEEHRAKLIAEAKAKLEAAVPLTFDYEGPDAEASPFMEDRFELHDWNCPIDCILATCHGGTIELIDNHSYESHLLYFDQLRDESFDLVHWLHINKSTRFDEMVRKKRNHKWHPTSDSCNCDSDDDDNPGDNDSDDDSDGDSDGGNPDGGSRRRNNDSATQILAASSRTSNSSSRGHGPGESQPALERNAARLCSSGRTVPKPIVVVVNIEGQPCRALLDSGSQSDFISTTLVDQLKLKTETLEKPLTLQLAVSGSRGKVKCLVTATISYQSVKEKRPFDVANLDSYDVILGLPFMVQHKLLIGFNPAQVTIRSVEPSPFEAEQSVHVASRAAEIRLDQIDVLREELTQYALDICKEAVETPLPPLRVINHVIPLIDNQKVYSWRPSKCPEPLKPLWRSKREDYVRTGRWEFRSGTNSVPMIMLKKPTKDGSLRLRTVLDTRQRNSNTRKLASPLPDIETILRNVASHPYRTLLDGKDAYEQIRVEPSDVPKTLFTTPDGTMVSYVMQIGDCNAGATYQSLMNHIFASYIGIFMDVYLDDIVIYSDSPEDHVKHVKLVIDVLRKNKFYLSSHKLQFFKSELAILGHLIDSKGIRMDPAKVDKVINWKAPSNKSLLASFIGSVSYLAPGCEGIRVPMALLAKRAAVSTPWQWSYTEQRAFDQVKEAVQKWRDVRRKPLDYSAKAEWINLTCDASLTGGSGVVSQGNDIKTAHIVAFWSGKFNSAQQNYPVHELELLAIVESLKRFRNLLHGVKFRAYTDHKGLEWITTQKKLSPRQARWLEVLSEFDFEIIYIPGETNTVADALSRMYSDEPLGTVRAASEYVAAEEENAPSPILLSLVTTPLYTGDFVYVGAARKKRGRKPKDPAREAFPNAKRVVLRVSDPEKPLEGELGGKADPNEDGNLGNQVNPPEIVEDDLEGALSDDERVLEHEEDPAEELLSEDPPTLTDLITLGDPTTDIHRSLANRYGEDPKFAEVLKNPSNYKNFEVSNGLVFLKDNGRRILCIPDIKIKERRVREMIISHAHSILAHLGPAKTIVYLRDNVWWKDLIKDVQAFCDTCVTCKVSKPNNHAPYGYLHTLEVPTRPWETIGVDFVGPLALSENLNGKFDMLMVIVDHLTSMVHLAPTKQTYHANDIAEVIFDRVYKHHGMPSHIVSDRDSLFSSIFWQTLNKLTGIELRMSSSFHPQSDGATERANRTITQMLRQCVSPHQRDWVKKLPAIEFAMNSARSATTGYAPFVLNYGRMPPSMIFESHSEYPGVKKFAEQMKTAVMEAHDAIINARVKQTQLANKKRKESPFAKGDLVYLSTQNISIPKGRARKLAPKFIGPYKILEDRNNNNYLLDLPPELKQRGLHPSFHANLLRIHEPNDDRRFPGRQLPQLVGIGKVEEWSVDKINDHQGKGKDALFELVYKTGDHFWLPYHEVKQLEALNQYMDLLGVKRIDQLPKKVMKSNTDADLIASSSQIVTDKSDNNSDGSSVDAIFVLEYIDQFIESLPKMLGGLEIDSKSRRYNKNTRHKMRSKKGRKSDSHLSTPMSQSIYTELELERFRSFAIAIINGKEMPNSFGYPAGYLDYCIENQHSPDPTKRLPFPPGAPVISVVLDGRETKVLTPTGLAPNLNQTSSQSGGRDAPRMAPTSEKRRAVPSKKKRFRFKKPSRFAKAGNAILERFQLDTDKERLAMGQGTSSVIRKGPSTPNPYRAKPYPEPRFGNMTLDNRRLGDVANPGTSSSGLQTQVSVPSTPFSAVTTSSVGSTAASTPMTTASTKTIIRDQDVVMDSVTLPPNDGTAGLELDLNKISLNKSPVPETSTTPTQSSSQAKDGRANVTPRIKFTKTRGASLAVSASSGAPTV